MFRLQIVLAALLAAGCSRDAAPPESPAQPAAPPASSAAAQPPQASQAAQAAPSSATERGPAEEVDNEAFALFREQKVDGAFVLLDLTTRALVVVNPSQASAGYLPASTFKIPNTLVGLETGVIPDASFHLKWDGKVKGFPGPNGALKPIADWNRDHDLASAMKFSAVWFYQEVARRIGPERMQRHIDAFGYGNRDTSGAIDSFWLGGKLRISPREQVEFLRKLHQGELPVKPEHAALVKKIIELESEGGVTLRGKTGLTTQGDLAVGWLVGSVERDAGTAVYATLVLAPAAEMDRMASIRKDLTRALLRRRGIPVREAAK